MTVHESDLAWLRQHLKDQLGDRRFPLSGSFELTWRCNFRCVHCYLRGSDPPAELDTEAVLRLLDTMSEAGVIGVSLTGGEPTIRADFAEIHAHAVRRGFLVSLFTNASLVDASLADFLAAHPPRVVEVTLYGSNPETYARLTGNPQHFDQTVEGIRHMVFRGLEVRCKAVLIKPLDEEAERLRELARSLGTTIHLDARIDPTLAGDVAPLRLRAKAGRAVAAELSDPKRVDGLVSAQRQHLLREQTFNATPCGAGHSTFHLDPRGRLMPCLQVRKPLIDASVQGFGEAWKQLGEGPRIAFASDSPCPECEIQYLCSHCPGLERVDVRPAGNQTYRECELARRRARVLEQRLTEELQPGDADE